MKLSFTYSVGLCKTRDYASRLEYVERKAEISHALTYLSEVCACLFQKEPRGRYFGLLKTVKVSITRKTLVKYLCNRRKQEIWIFGGKKYKKKKKNEQKLGKLNRKRFLLAFTLEHEEPQTESTYCNTNCNWRFQNSVTMQHRKYTKSVNSDF